MSRYSLDRFTALWRMLDRELGEELSEKIFDDIIETLGPGDRIMVPKFKDVGRLRTKYYWNPQRGHPKTFKEVLNLLCNHLGDSTGVVLFKNIIAELGAGERLTVPYAGCSQDVCNCRKICLWRLQRDEEIRRKFRGANHRELSLHYSLGVRQVRRIVNGR